MRSGGGPPLVEVWTARLDDLPLDSSWLDPVERGRRDALLREPDRRRFVGGALLVRAVAGTALGVAPELLGVDRRCPSCGGPHGRPSVAGAPSMSVSHSGSVVMLASSTAGDVGVDTEPADRQVDPAIVPLVLGGGERIAAPDELLRYWVRKEAVLKACGVGLTVPMTDLTVSTPDSPPRVLTHRLGTDAPIGLIDVPVPGQVTAVAVVGAAELRVAVRKFRYRLCA